LLIPAVALKQIQAQREGAQYDQGWHHRHDDGESGGAQQPILMMLCVPHHPAWPAVTCVLLHAAHMHSQTWLCNDICAAACSMYAETDKVPL